MDDSDWIAASLRLLAMTSFNGESSFSVGSVKYWRGLSRKRKRAARRTGDPLS
jgi:hypothetical protein